MSESDRAELVKMFNDGAERAAWPTHCDIVLSFSSQMLREALAAWRTKTVGQQYPSRADMSPRAMKNFLPNVAIVDVCEEDGRFRSRLRVTGSWIDRHLIPASNQFLDETVPEPFLGRWQSLLKLCLDVEGPIRCLTEGLQFRHQDFLSAETFFAPLAEPGRHPNAILAVMTVHSRFKSASSDRSQTQVQKVSPS
jgi:hypothetical protein